MAHFGLGNFAAAQQQFETSITLATEPDPATYVQLFNTLQKNKKPTEALAVLETWLRLFPKGPKRRAIEDAAKKVRASLRQ